MKIDIDLLIPEAACQEALHSLVGDPAALLARMNRYFELIQEWNDFASLMSRKEAEEGIPGHIADSLSLVPVIAGLLAAEPQAQRQPRLIDIGSGGGFPAIPIAAALPDLGIVLIERSQRKAGFLQKAVGALGLTKVQVHCTTFPNPDLTSGGTLHTARAVERPSELVPKILSQLGLGDTFLNQTAVHAKGGSEAFRVEPIEDAWTRAGLRRGTLELVRRIR